jgi:uncharacterized membrane protein (UPF0127 family)
MKKYLILIVAILCLVSCGKKQKKHVDFSKTTVLKRYGFDNPPKFRKDGELIFMNAKNDTLFHINIENAITSDDRYRGLMYRPQMDENNGMFFVMDYEDTQSFYMRNTIIPLDIIYVNANYEIVDIYKNTKIKDETSLPSAKPALFVVEINAGLCDKYNINITDKIQLIN